jgi:ABC-type polysaccharide/polyol phosphate export permease
MIVLTIVFSSLFRFNVENYSIYILSGLVVWNFFSSSTHAAMGEMICSGTLLNRIYMPKSAFPVSAVGTGLVNLGISLIPLLAIAIAVGIKINISILVIPLATLLLAAFALGVGLVLATTAVYFADMLPVYDVILTIWMYATPIIYPIEIIPSNLQWLFRLNPLYHMIELFRAPLYLGTFPEWQTWVIATLYSLAALLLGGLVFTAKSNDYAYRI